MTRAPTLLHFLLLLLALTGMALLPRAARAQAPTVAVTPAGPLALCPGGSQTLTATATVASFNAGGAGADGDVLTLARQPDGKVLVGGSFASYNGNAAAPDNLVRLNADGTLDATFNAGGTGPNSVVQALALQPDGKVLIGGLFTAYNGNSGRFRIMRLNADGSPDATFNPGGGGTEESVRALAVQPDGKILVGGIFTAYNNNFSAPNYVLRLNADGTLDTNFNAGGVGPDYFVFALALQPDGKVLVGGDFSNYNNSTAAVPDKLLRLNATGTLDATFNAGGTGPDGGVQALTLQPDGKVLVGGFFTAYNGGAAPDYVLRVNATGTLDATFNAGGSGASSVVYELALQPDGKVLVGGQLTQYNGAAAPDYVLRLDANGSLDGTFNPGGTGANNLVFALAALPDDKAMVGGYFIRYNGSDAAPNGVLRLNANGSLDNGVLADLAYTWNTGATSPSITVSQLGDYRVTATSTSYGTGVSPAVRVSAPPAVAVALAPAGPLTLTGGASATLTATATLPAFNIGAGTRGFDGIVRAVVVQPDGKVLVGGSFTSYNGAAAAPDYVLRLNADGSLDAAFNAGGTGLSFVANALALQPDGRVLVGGDFMSYNGNAAAPDRLLRLNADGSLDATFNVGGTGAENTVLTLALLPEGKIMMGGLFTAYNGSAGRARVLRLNANGTRDNTFNVGGSGADAFVSALVPLLDGKVLVGGSFTSYNASAAPDRVMRLNADGTLDATFNAGGTGPNSDVRALALQPDGRVVVGGGFTAYNGNAAAPDRLLRLNADGSLDGTFNPGGGANNSVYALVVQPDGKVLVGGEFTTYNASAAPPDYVLRLNTDGTLDAAFNPSGGANGIVYALALQPDSRVLVGGEFTAYNSNPATPGRLLRLNANGSLHETAAALAGATFVFSPGGTTGSTRSVSTAGTYTATVTDPATGCTYTSNAVEVTTAPLPVELSAFTATPQGPAAVRLAWTTASEVNSAHFKVERSSDSRTFAAVGTVAAAGSSSGPRRYALLDTQLPAGTAMLYYRLRQVDQDGTFSYSSVRAVTLTGAAAGLALFPNPAHGGAATLTGARYGTVVRVFDALGRPVLTATADAAGKAGLTLPTGYATGVYVVRVGHKALRLIVE